MYFYVIHVASILPSFLDFYLFVDAAEETRLASSTPNDSGTGSPLGSKRNSAATAYTAQRPYVQPVTAVVESINFKTGGGDFKGGSGGGTSVLGSKTGVSVDSYDNRGIDQVHVDLLIEKQILNQLKPNFKAKILINVTSLHLILKRQLHRFNLTFSSLNLLYCVSGCYVRHKKNTILCIFSSRTYGKFFIFFNFYLSSWVICSAFWRSKERQLQPGE